jgi:endonuclease-3
MDKKKAEKIYKLLAENYFHKEAFLVNSNPLELLVATILSAQCTDKRVNIVTRDLFNKYRTVKDYASADHKVFEKDIRSTGFYRNKAKNIIAAAKKMIKEYAGKVPETMEDLVTLPGVARKTANIVLYHGFGKCEGIAVDTHVKRVSYRLGLTSETDPEKIERDLMGLFSRGKWGRLNNLIIEHGRKICDARKPLCVECPFEKFCPKTGIV